MQIMVTTYMKERWTRHQSHPVAFLSIFRQWLFMAIIGLLALLPFAFLLCLCVCVFVYYLKTRNVKLSINLAQRVNEGPKSKIYCLSSTFLPPQFKECTYSSEGVFLFFCLFTSPCFIPTWKYINVCMYAFSFTLCFFLCRVIYQQQFFLLWQLLPCYYAHNSHI